MAENKTTEDVRDLKVQWLKAPSWDIEETPGFEAHHDELIRFRMGSEIIWSARSEGMHQMPAEVVARATELGLSITEVMKLDSAISVTPA